MCEKAISEMFSSRQENQEVLIVDKVEFEELPKKFKETINTKGIIRSEEEEYFSITFQTPGLASQIAQDYQKYERNKGRSEHRRWLMSMSSGVHEKSDLSEIFLIQEGRCYFTGEPLSEKNYSLDHLKPISKGGSDWPSNLAFVLKSVNQEKHHRTAAAYWHLLAKKHGDEWVRRRKEICQVVNKKRSVIHRKRKNEVTANIAELESYLSSAFPDVYVSLSLSSGDALVLFVDGTYVSFEEGILREKRKMKNTAYFESIIRSIIGVSIGNTHNK